MKRINFPVVFTIILLVFNSNQVKSSTITKDTLTAIYKGIPEDGIFDKWLLLGPIPVFKDKPNPEDQIAQKKAFDRDQIIPSKVPLGIIEKRLLINNSLYNWKFVQTDEGIVNGILLDNRKVDLTKILGDSAYAIAYAYIQIEMPEEKEFILAAGSDDAIKIWVNKDLVHSNWAARGLQFDNDLVPVKLKKGNNEILIKIQNRGYSWAFGCQAIMPSQYSEKLISFTQSGAIDNIKQLLKSGADINAVSYLGLTPLQTARIYRQEKLVDFFLEQGADSTIPMPSKERIVDAYFNNMTKKDYPGAAVLISKDGNILYKKAYGFADLENEIPFKVDSKFRICSVTKQFTASAIMKLQEQGLLTLDDTVSKYIPELPNGNKVTIHHLLTHTSGLQRDWGKEHYQNIPIEYKTEDIIKTIKNLKYDFKPGESWNYSNCGYVVLSCIIERVSGLSYLDFLRKNFFEPLGMLNTGIHQWNDFLGCEILKDEVCGYYYENGIIYRTVNLDRTAGAGALYSTLEDLFKWNEAIFNNKVLNEADLKAAFTPVIPGDGISDRFGFQYGYGWMISKLDDLGRIHHGGATDGYECNLNRFTDNNMNVIVFLNRFPFPPGINADIAAKDVERIYLWEEMNKENKR
jgi:CubicO group peptidase (beta-lactamase class C family)